MGNYWVQTDTSTDAWRWRWCCTCGAKGKWQYQSPDASYYKWLRHRCKLGDHND